MPHPQPDRYRATLFPLAVLFLPLLGRYKVSCSGVFALLRVLSCLLPNDSFCQGSTWGTEGGPLSRSQSILSRQRSSFSVFPTQGPSPRWLLPRIVAVRSSTRELEPLPGTRPGGSPGAAVAHLHLPQERPLQPRRQRLDNLGVTTALARGGGGGTTEGAEKARRERGPMCADATGTEGTRETSSGARRFVGVQVWGPE